jgi:hypothetical protein
MVWLTLTNGFLGISTSLEAYNSAILQIPSPSRHRYLQVLSVIKTIGCIVSALPLLLERVGVRRIKSTT